jgi:aryl-alcohol dehydrogenase-like predicted oxidoreductase
MRNVSLAGHAVSGIGLGCMSMSAGVGAGDAASTRSIRRVLDLGVSFLDTETSN